MVRMRILPTGRLISSERTISRSGELIEPHGFLYGLPGKIHVGGGLHQQDMPAIQHGLTGHGMEAGALHGGAAVLSQNIQRAEADIMPGIAVFAAGVAQPADDKFHRTMDRD